MAVMLPLFTARAVLFFFFLWHAFRVFVFSLTTFIFWLISFSYVKMLFWRLLVAGVVALFGFVLTPVAWWIIFVIAFFIPNIALGVALPLYFLALVINLTHFG